METINTWVEKHLKDQVTWSDLSASYGYFQGDTKDHGQLVSLLIRPTGVTFGERPKIIKSLETTGSPNFNLKVRPQSIEVVAVTKKVTYNRMRMAMGRPSIKITPIGGVGWVPKDLVPLLPRLDLTPHCISHYALRPTAWQGTYPTLLIGVTIWGLDKPPAFWEELRNQYYVTAEHTNVYRWLKIERKEN